MERPYKQHIMDIRRYNIYIKHRFGWKAESWGGFFRTYEEIPKRKELVSLPRKGYIFDQHTGTTLSLLDGLKLLFQYEFSQCTDFIDWELFIDTYKEFQEDELIKKATRNLKIKLLDADLLIILHKYTRRFPDGLFFAEAKTKIALLIREEEYKAQPPEEMTESERKTAVSDVEKVVDKIVANYVGSDKKVKFSDVKYENNNEVIIKFFEDKKITIASESIEKTVKDVLKLLPSLRIPKEHADILISISASFHELRRQERYGIITPQEGQKAYQLIIYRILKEFNLIIDDLHSS